MQNNFRKQTFKKKNHKKKLKTNSHI